jgi:hypothetical protein
LELASKNIISGSVKMVYAIVFSLFLVSGYKFFSDCRGLCPSLLKGFGLTIGSDLYYLIDSNARHTRDAVTAGLAEVLTIHGNFTADNTTAFSNLGGTFSFSNGSSEDVVLHQYHYQAKGCYRDPTWPWFLQPFPKWTLFVLVPLYSLFSSSWNLQPLKDRQLPVMVIISCCSYAG